MRGTQKYLPMAKVSARHREDVLRVAIATDYDVASRNLGVSKMTVVMETVSEHPSAEGTLLSSFRENADFAAEQDLGEGNARDINAAEAAKRITKAFGKVVGVLMRSPQHKQSKLADLERMVVPAIMTGQFTLAEARSKSDGTTAPVGFVSWARVSADVDARLAASTDSRSC